MNFLKKLFTKKPEPVMFTLRLSEDNCDRIKEGYVLERELRLDGHKTTSWVHISLEQ